MRLRQIGIVLAASAGLAFSQTFEVVSIRPSGPNTARRFTLDRSQLVARAQTLATLIASSYPDVPLWRVSGGPSWATKDLWDVVAKCPPGIPSDEQQLWRKTEQMLRTLLADEFRLQTHFEHREQSVYELVIAKGGPKLRPSVADEFSYRATSTGMEVRHVVMADFATLLYSPNSRREVADRFVVDKTGLTGYYDFSLNWAPANIQPDTADPQPSIFTAIQEQLGLRLQPGKETVDFLVIDRAERPPEN